MPTDSPRYSASTELLSATVRDGAATTWRAEYLRELGTPVQQCLRLVGGMGALGAALGAVPMLGGGAYRVATPAVFAAMGGGLFALVVVRARRAKAELEARIADLGAMGAVTVHTLRVDGTHRFLPHDHGIMVLVPLDAGRCVVLDLSSVASDPRHEPVEAALRAGAVPSLWRWVETDDGTLLDFAMSGATTAPVTGDEGRVMDDDAPFAQVIDAVPDRGVVAALDFDALFAPATR